jgi:hypothetical protein
LIVAFDFPGSPVLNQVWTAPTGQGYTWSGTAWNLSSPATSQTATALSRNLIVNPCGHISQELGNAAQTVTNVYIADQWDVQVTASGAAFTTKSDGAVINPSGSTIRLLFKTTTAKASLAAGDLAVLETKLEAFRALPLGYAGNAPVQSVLRFGFNGPAGTYSVSIRNYGNNTLSWIGQFTIAAGQANTDTVQVLVIPAPPTGYTWGSGTAAQIDLIITLAAGTTFIAPANGWQAGNFVAGPGQFNLLGTVNNQAQIWDVGLYADPNRTGLPPAFQVPDYALDLFECKRYWQQVFTMWSGAVNNGTSFHAPANFPVAPRATPSLVGVSLGQGSFPAAVGTLTIATSGNGIYEVRAASATGPTGYFLSNIAANARM